MKINKTANKVKYLKQQKLIANKGCDICPCCGETKPNYTYATVVNKGILSGIYKTYNKGLFNPKCMKIDCYSCLTCGAEWESEPYEY